MATTKTGEAKAFSEWRENRSNGRKASGQSSSQSASSARNASGPSTSFSDWRERRSENVKSGGNLSQDWQVQQSQPSREDEIYNALTAGMQQNQVRRDADGNNTNDERDALLREYGEIRNKYAGVNMTIGARAQFDKETGDVLKRLAAVDSILGNQKQDYSKYAFNLGERIGGTIGGSVVRGASGIVNAVGTALEAENARRDPNYVLQNAIQGSDFATQVGQQGVDQFTAAMPKEQEAYKIADQSNINKVYNVADTMSDAAAQQTEGAKHGLGNVGRTLVDVGGGLTDVAIDTGLNYIMPGLGMIRMGTSAFGSAAQEARRQGKDIDEQVFQGIKSAGIEVLTEKIGGPFEKAYGGTLLGKATNEAVEKLGKNSAFRKFLLKSGANFLSEGGEEVMSNFLNTFIDRIMERKAGGYYAKLIEAGRIRGQLEDARAKGLPTDALEQQLRQAELEQKAIEDKLKETLSQYDLSEMLYEGLVGGLAGLVGGTGEAITQARIDAAVDRAVAAADERDARAERGEATDARGIIKNEPVTKAQQLVANLLTANSEDAVDVILSDNKYKAAFQDLTDKPATAENIEEFLQASQEAAGAQEAAGNESVPPSPQTSSTEPPVALNSNQSEMAPPESVEQATNPATEALLNPVVQQQEEARSQLPPKPLRSGADMALWALGLDQQNQQDAREAEGIDIDAADFDDGGADAGDIINEVRGWNEGLPNSETNGNMVTDNENGGQENGERAESAERENAADLGAGTQVRGGKQYAPISASPTDGRGTVEDVRSEFRGRDFRRPKTVGEQSASDTVYKLGWGRVTTHIVDNTTPSPCFGETHPGINGASDVYILENLPGGDITTRVTGTHEGVHAGLIALGGRDADAVAVSLYTDFLNGNPKMSMISGRLLTYVAHGYAANETPTKILKALNPNAQDYSAQVAGVFSLYSPKTQGVLANEFLAFASSGSALARTSSGAAELDVLQSAVRQYLVDCGFCENGDFDNSPTASEYFTVQADVRNYINALRNTGNVQQSGNRPFIPVGVSGEALEYLTAHEKFLEEQGRKANQKSAGETTEGEIERSRESYSKEKVGESGFDASERRDAERMRGEAAARVNRRTFSDEDANVESRNRNKGGYYELRITARAQIEDDNRNISRIVDGQGEWADVSARYRADLLNDILKTDRYYTRGNEVVENDERLHRDYSEFDEDDPDVEEITSETDKHSKAKPTTAEQRLLAAHDRNIAMRTELQKEIERARDAGQPTAALESWMERLKAEGKELSAKIGKVGENESRKGRYDYSEEDDSGFGRRRPALSEQEKKSAGRALSEQRYRQGLKNAEKEGYNPLQHKSLGRPASYDSIPKFCYEIMSSMDELEAFVKGKYEYGRFSAANRFEACRKMFPDANWQLDPETNTITVGKGEKALFNPTANMGSSETISAYTNLDSSRAQDEADRRVARQNRINALEVQEAKGLFGGGVDVSAGDFEDSFINLTKPFSDDIADTLNARDQEIDQMLSGLDEEAYEMERRPAQTYELTEADKRFLEEQDRRREERQEHEKNVRAVADKINAQKASKTQRSAKPADGDATLNQRDQEIDELEKRDKRREEDEYQEKRWGDKHSIDNAKGWEQQERQRAKAEQEQTTGPKYAVREQLGSEAHDAVNRAARKLAKDTSEPIKGDESKRKLSKHYAKAESVITTMSDFAEGNASFSDLVEEYGKLEGTAFYDKSTHDQLKAVKDLVEAEEEGWQHFAEDGRFVDNTGKTGGQYKAETAKAVAKAVQQINHRVKRVGEVGVKPRAELNGDIRAGAKGRAKTTTKMIEKFTGMQLRPDVMFKKLGGFVKGSAPYQLAEKHMQAIKDKQNQKQAALEYFISATKMKGYEDFAKGKTTIKNPVPGHGDSQMSLNTALGLLKTLETNGAIEHIVKNAEKGGVQFAASEKELYSGAHSNGFGDKASYGQTLSMLSDKTIERLANAKSGKEIAHARATAQLELEALRNTLKAEVMKNDVAKAMYNASFGCMRYLGMNMNDASQTMWGVDFATEGRNYYPLEIASQGKVRELLNDPRGGLKNMGIVQERTGASGALRIRPFTDVMSHYIEQSTDWSAFSVLSDELELLSRNNGGGDTGLTATIGNEYGKFYADWLDNYVKDLNGTREGGVQFSGLRSKLASAALTLNGGVALKQSPSYFDAAGIIDMGILVKHSPGLFKTAKSFENNPLIQEVEMRTGMLGQRKMGYNAVEVGEATESARGLSSKVNKWLPNWMTNWITKTDVRTTSNLMLACADQVMAESADGRGPKVEKGSEEYYRAIADKFEQVILQSQPVFTKQARADYMRNPSDVIRTLAMFRTQQTQNFNQLVAAIGEYQNASAKDKAAAGKQLVTVASGQIIASAMFSVLSAVARAGLHKFDDFKDDEGWSEEKIAKRLGLNMLGSVAGTVWFGNELASFAVDALSGGNTSEFQGLDDNVMSMITDAATSVISWTGDKKDLVKIKNLVLNVSQAFGIPARNAYNMLNSVVMFGLDRSRAANGGAVWDSGKSSDFVKMLNDYNEQDDKKRAKATFDVAMRAMAAGDDARYTALMSTLDYENDDVVDAIKTSARQQFALGEIDIATYKQILTKWGKMTASDAQAYVEGQEEKRELAELMENDAVAQLDQQISDAKDRADEYDSSRDYAAMDLIIGALLDDVDTDKLVRAKTSKGYRTSYEAMRQTGMTPKEASTTYKAMDGDNNGSLKQDELVEYYLANPGMEYIIKQIWATKGWKTSWETKRDKAK